MSGYRNTKWHIERFRFLFRSRLIRTILFISQITSKTTSNEITIIYIQIHFYVQIKKKTLCNRPTRRLGKNQTIFHTINYSGLHSSLLKNKFYTKRYA